MLESEAQGSQDLRTVLCDEFELLHQVKPKAENLADLYMAIGALKTPRSALCLSGGGIRSASFSLGVLQALSRHHLLTQFHYLSTVSGGGYIGAWLSAWRHHCGDATVNSGLSARTVDPPEEVAELRGVRANSNFITPRVGLLSADTWTGVALYFRNLFLNWLVLGPLMMAVLTVPIGAYEVSRWAQGWSFLASPVLVLVASVFLVLAGAVSVGSRPGSGSASISQRRYLLLILLPTYAAAVALALSAVNTQGLIVARAFQGLFADFTLPWALWGMLVFGSSWLLGFAFGWRNRLGKYAILPSEDDPITPPMLFATWTVSGAFSGFIFGTGLYWWSNMGVMPIFASLGLSADAAVKLLVVFGVAWTMLSMLVGELLYVGLASYSSHGDLEREWLARSAGWLVATATIWTVLALAVLFGFSALQYVASRALVLGGGTLSGIATLAIAASGKTSATLERLTPRNLKAMQIVSITAVIFLVFLVTLLSGALQAILDVWNRVWWVGEPYGRSLVVVVVAAALFALAWTNSLFVNVNRFSLHAVYRNRLVRAFLGSARARAVPAREPDKFSGFDQHDNVTLSSVAPSRVRGTGPCLFHVVNQTLNVVSSPDLAWQERKAESFVMTPLVCGNPRVGFRPSTMYAKNVTLGTAMAISGAAVSPNQGYYSSPLVGLLMMLFNVRLGWWLGNPGNPKTYWREGPRLGVGPIVRELFGLTTGDAPYVYLSDGGHFEDLGVYEMVRRRCRFVVVVDAGSDKDGTFQDLGNAMRKIWIDLGARVEFKKVATMGRPTNPAGAAYAAIGQIIYPEGGPPGAIVYIKPGFFGTEPVDVRSYGNVHPDFPHDTTLDQWFSESQMESYRSLGSYIVDELCLNREAAIDDMRSPESIDGAEFLARVRAYIGAAAKASVDQPQPPVKP